MIRPAIISLVDNINKVYMATVHIDGYPNRWKIENSEDFPAYMVSDLYKGFPTTALVEIIEVGHEERSVNFVDPKKVELVKKD